MIMRKQTLNQILKIISLILSWATLSPLLLILDGRWKLLPKWLRIVLFVLSPMMLVIIAAVAFLCYAYYWDYYYPRHHFVKPKVVENIIGMRLPRYKVIEYDKDRRSFNGDYSDGFTLEFRKMPDDDFYDELDKHFRQYIPTRQQLDSIPEDVTYIFSPRVEILDSTVYCFERWWGNGVEAPKGESDRGDIIYRIRIERGTKTFHISVIGW